MTMPAQTDVRLWLAILHELERRGGSARPEEIFPTIRPYFPQLTDAETSRFHAVSGANVWIKRIRWARQELVFRGLLDNSTRGLWRISDAGRRWLREIWRGAEADYRKVPRPPLVQDVASRVSPGPTVPHTPQPPHSSQPATSRVTAQPSSAGDAPAMERLVARSLADGRHLSAVDRYLVAVVAYELGRFPDAAALLDEALALGPAGEYHDKAKRLLAMCALRSGA